MATVLHALIFRRAGLVARPAICLKRLLGVSLVVFATCQLILHLLVPPTTYYQQRLLHTSVVRKDAPQVPDFGYYRANNTESNRALSYFVVGSMGVISASVAKSSVTEFLKTMSASADVLAMAKVEVELGNIPEGKNVIIKWRGKPVFIRHRTQSEIDEARNAEWKSFRDPQSDEDRTKQPQWLVMLGVCTHLGCVPIGESGDYNGWYAQQLAPFCVYLIHLLGSVHAMVLIMISVTLFASPHCYSSLFFQPVAFVKVLRL